MLPNIPSSFASFSEWPQYSPVRVGKGGTTIRSDIPRIERVFAAARHWQNFPVYADYLKAYRNEPRLNTGSLVRAIEGYRSRHPQIIELERKWDEILRNNVDTDVLDEFARRQHLGFDYSDVELKKWKTAI